MIELTLMQRFFAFWCGCLAPLPLFQGGAALALPAQSHPWTLDWTLFWMFAALVATIPWMAAAAIDLLFGHAGLLRIKPGAAFFAGLVITSLAFTLYLLSLPDPPPGPMPLLLAGPILLYYLLTRRPGLPHVPAPSAELYRFIFILATVLWPFHFGGWLILSFFSVVAGIGLLGIDAPASALVLLIVLPALLLSVLSVIVHAKSGETPDD